MTKTKDRNTSMHFLWQNPRTAPIKPSYAGWALVCYLNLLLLTSGLWGLRSSESTLWVAFSLPYSLKLCWNMIYSPRFSRTTAKRNNNRLNLTPGMCFAMDRNCQINLRSAIAKVRSCFSHKLVGFRLSHCWHIHSRTINGLGSAARN